MRELRLDRIGDEFTPGSSSSDSTECTFQFRRHEIPAAQRGSEPNPRGPATRHTGQRLASSAPRPADRARPAQARRPARGEGHLRRQVRVDQRLVDRTARTARCTDSGPPAGPQHVPQVSRKRKRRDRREPSWSPPQAPACKCREGRTRPIRRTRGRPQKPPPRPPATYQLGQVVDELRQPARPRGPAVSNVLQAGGHLTQATPCTSESSQAVEQRPRGRGPARRRGILRRPTPRRLAFA